MKLRWDSPDGDKVCLVLLIESTHQYKRFFDLYQYLLPQYCPIDYLSIENYYFSYWVPEIWKLIDSVCAETAFDTEDFIEAYHARYGC